MTLTTRLAIAMTLLVAVAVSAVGWVSYRNLQRSLLPRILDRIEVTGKLAASDLKAYARGARADVSTFSSRAAVRGMVMAHVDGGIDPIDHLTEGAWRARLLTELTAELGAKPTYAQFRFIGIADGGRELVRVDRFGPGGAARVVPDAQLQQAGDRAYFKKTIKLAADQIYVSPVDVVQKAGAFAARRVPTLRVAAPIFAPDGKPFGVVAIDVDMRRAFDRIRTPARPGERIYLVDAQGDYLVDPDRAHQFAGDRDVQGKWQTDFPYFAALTGSQQSAARIVRDRNGRPAGAALVPAVLAGQQWIGIIETVPNAVLRATAATIRDSTLLVGSIAVLCAAALAVIIARSLTAPINPLRATVERIGRGETVAIPLDAGGETGVLARAFARVISEAKARTAELEREVEERRRTEAARDHHAARERLFSAAVESSNDAIVTESLDGTITGWNPAAEHLFGYTADEAIGKDINLIIPPDRVKEGQTVLRRIGRGERIGRHDTMRLRKDGTLVLVSLSISPIKNASGEIIGASEIARDVTELRRTEQTLRQQVEERERIIETSLDAFIQIDQSGRILNWNSHAERIFGWSRREAFGKNIFGLIGRQDGQGPVRLALEAFLQSGQSQVAMPRREVQVRRRDGTEFTAELSITALKTRDGFVFNGFVRDLTEKIAAAERIRQSEKMEAIGQLTGGIAHDFNNILTVITGTIEILGAAVAKEPQLAAITKMIDEAAARGADLTRHLLAFARRQPLQPRETDVNTLIIDTAKLLRPTLGERIEIESVFEDETCIALVDPNQLTTAILNLALNSRDAMPNGGKLIMETASAFLDETYAAAHGDVRSGHYALIAVSDTGAGIPASILDKVFDPFFTSKGPGKGTGLGLSMVYGFVKQSAGHIKIYSEEGHGTTIKMYLPPGTGTAGAPAGGRATEIHGGSETILVVEDDALVKDYVLAQLHSLGYRTLAAANATEALAIAAAGHAFDLLFTDVIMPGAMNGRELANALQKERPDLKVLFTSGYTENAIIHHGRLDSGVLLLAKPYRKSDMAQMIRRALDDRSMIWNGA
jgi:PAS domain S-box-containing protein